MISQTFATFHHLATDRVHVLPLHPAGDGVIYVRSTDADADALHQQAELVAATLERSGETAAVLVAASGVAGTGRFGDDHRPDLRELFELVRQRRIRWVALASLDRLSRSFADAQAIRARMAEFGVSVHLADSHSAMARLLSAAARGPVLQLEEATQVESLPRGFRRTSEGRLVLDEAQFESVETLYDMRGPNLNGKVNR
jgi:cytosine/adenosine deaminase-related metal-dependent hydrolase